MTFVNSFEINLLLIASLINNRALNPISKEKLIDKLSTKYFYEFQFCQRSRLCVRVNASAPTIPRCSRASHRRPSSPTIPALVLVTLVCVFVMSRAIWKGLIVASLSLVLKPMSLTFEERNVVYSDNLMSNLAIKRSFQRVFLTPNTSNNDVVLIEKNVKMKKKNEKKVSTIKKFRKRCRKTNVWFFERIRDCQI